eukprot:7426585-Pyramimonas_sp.AAC.1
MAPKSATQVSLDSPRVPQMRHTGPRNGHSPPSTASMLPTRHPRRPKRAPNCSPRELAQAE